MPPSIREIFAVFGKIGLLSFGGPAAQIALMHRVIVEERAWLSERQYLNALSFCMLLPGPEAMQLATYAGWRLRGTVGGLIAGGLFVIPGAIVVLVLAAIYAELGNVAFVQSVFLGIKAAVVIVVIEALLRVSKKALNGWGQWVIAAAAFIGIFFLGLPYPLIVLAAAVYGFFWGVRRDTGMEPVVHKPFKNSLGTVFVWLLVWGLPVAILWIAAPPILTEIAAFFSKLAVVTFGGAYAVLAYMGQDVVGNYGWLTAGQMMDGLGLAETTPGPLILVTEFVGFLAGYSSGGIGLGIAAAIVTLWVTFIPCFLWIFTFAPYIDWMSNQPRLNGALGAITAAVVGVILNLSIWFGLHVFFDTVTLNDLGWLNLWQPTLASFNWRAGVLAVICGVLLLWRHWSITPVLLVAAVLGVGLGAVG